jgi:sporulation protein YlmC with PRC-barrel domain
MLQNIKELYGHKLSSIDGEIGHIKDFYFDDQRWAVRYLVADTGSWLTGRLVLISPHAFDYFDRDSKQLHVKLSRPQIEKSPSIDAHRPVSRQHEEAYFAYYGWPDYWTGDLLWGAAGFPLVTAPQNGVTLHHGHNQRNDLHLRSTKALKGYDIQANDGPIGSVTSFMVDDKSWAIGELIVETGHWYWGKEVRIPASSIKRISYEESLVFVNLSKAEIQGVSERDLAKVGA